MADASRDQNNVPTLIAASNSDGVTPVKVYANPTTHRLLVDLAGGSGTVTSVSVVSANGFAGSVANATTTPAITLTTTITGILQGNGTAISAASTTGSGAVVLETSPTLVTPVLGVATATSIAIGGAAIGANAFAVTGSSSLGATTIGGTLALGANNITMSGSIASALTRVTIGYFTDLNVTNAIAGSVTGNAATATALQTARTIGGVSFDGTANITVATATGGFTVSGGNLALGTNSITMTGSLAATGSRVTKGWFTDLEVTNYPTVNGTAIDSTFAPKASPTFTGTVVLPTTTLGGVMTLNEGASIRLDAAGSADGAYSGITIAGTAGATLAFGDLIYLAAADSRWELADADAASTSGDVILGMCVLAAASDGDPTVILLYGNIRADANFPALTIGAPAYVSTTPGDIQVAQPSGTDDVIRRVGFALTADELLFNPSNDYITHT